MEKDTCYNLSYNLKITNVTYHCCQIIKKMELTGPWLHLLYIEPLYHIQTRCLKAEYFHELQDRWPKRKHFTINDSWNKYVIKRHSTSRLNWFKFCIAGLTFWKSGCQTLPKLPGVMQNKDKMRPSSSEIIHKKHNWFTRLKKIQQLFSEHHFLLFRSCLFLG